MQNMLLTSCFCTIRYSTVEKLKKKVIPESPTRIHLLNFNFITTDKKKKKKSKLVSW